MAALDLGTNNCRLLIARQGNNGFQVIDAFSRIVRLGEGVSQSGALSATAMDRTIGEKIVTYDFARLMEGAQEVSTSAFGDALIRNL